MLDTVHTCSKFKKKLNYLNVATLGFFIVCHFSLASVADPSQEKTFKNKNSSCVVKSSAGEYPDTFVYIKHQKILGPLSWGLTFSRFSPSGNYIALTNSESEWFTDNGNHFKIAIVNCKSRKVKYYLNSVDVSKKGKSLYYTWASITNWSKDEHEIQYDDYYDYDKSRKEKLVFLQADKL